jgi:DNA-binding response OmpR family regulator
VIRRVLRFGDCRLDIATRAPWRAGVRVDLPSTVFDGIAYLIERRARAGMRSSRARHLKVRPWRSQPAASSSPPRSA